MRLFALLIVVTAVASCAHVAPTDPNTAPAPWPSPAPPLVTKASPAPAEPPESKKTPVPPLKSDVIPPTPPQNTPPH